MEQQLATFGIWDVTSEGINAAEEFQYDIGIRELFATQIEDGKKVWDFPIHLTAKSWLQGEVGHERMRDFNQAFVFAQKYFQAQRPSASMDVDDAYTWQLQRELIH